MAGSQTGLAGRPPRISLLEARKWALAELAAAGYPADQAADDLDFLLSGALDMNYGMLRANITRTMPAELAQVWPTWVAQLIKQVPPQYILGQAPFYGREFAVDDRVLIPRPETELLVEWILKDWPKLDRPVKVLDLGTGSGAILATLALEKPGQVAGLATDISAAALVVAQQNFKRLGATGLATQVSDVWSEIAPQQFDLVVSNPPYIDHDHLDEVDDRVDQAEPGLALYAENHGLAIYQAIAAQLGAYLAPQGAAYFEIGYDQGQAVKEIMAAALPTASVEVLQDFAGLDRMIKVQNHGNAGI
ncbi:peptide chain release factor N(5)-glutamine methyltransferase [Leuconostocaceae bacterium ESL0723]|nr:peptide chain release factor N(5)-glutamine methyltransferase [Leuconostocaceae bacterium ESL0723]